MSRHADVLAEARVLAVPGARSTDLAAQVEHLAGWRPDVAVIVIGANDLTHLVPVDAAAQQLRAAVRDLRARQAEGGRVAAGDHHRGLAPVVRPAALGRQARRAG